MREAKRLQRRIVPMLRDVEKPTLVLMGLAGIYLSFTAFTWYFDLGALLSDAHSYWLTGQAGYEPYVLAPGVKDAYLYSPAFAQLITPLTWLPWPGFALTWFVLEALTFIWLFRPLGWWWTVVLVLWCTPELMIGNIFGFLAAATVLGLTGHPSALAFPILTKPPLGITAFWFVARREFKALGVVVLATAAVVAISFVIDPSAWSAWFRFLLDHSSDARPAYPAYVIVAIGLIVYAARTNRAWLIPFAMVMATPVFGGSGIWMLLAAIPRLAMRDRPAADGARDVHNSQRIDDPSDIPKV